MTSFIQSDQVWLIWAVVISLGAFAILAEQKFKWGGKIGSAIIAIFSALILVNVRLIPVSSEVYTVINSYILPLSIPLLLFQCDLRRIIRDSGKLAVIFFVAAVGTLIGVAVCGLMFKDVEGVGGIAAMTTGAHIGGTVNLVAMGQTFNMEANYVNACAIAANLFLAFYMLMLSSAANLKFVRKMYPHPYIDEMERAAELGNFAIILFFVGLGCAANLAELAQIGVVVIAFIICIMIFNFLVTMAIGKIFKWSYEEISLACNATFGGPTTAAAFAINKGWHELVVPSILVGLLGYIIGNYFGVLIGNLLM